MLYGEHTSQLMTFGKNVANQGVFNVIIIKIRWQKRIKKKQLNL